MLKIGKTLELPLEWVTLATVVYGARGSGKTSFGRRAAEEAHRLGQRFCAIDLKGDWYGLKSSADGKSAGLPVVVFGGDHQDLPLEEGAGAFVAETVAGLQQSTILDLEYFSKGKQVRFLAAFFDRLYDANRDNLLLLLDEAQRYAPQGRMLDPDSAKCLGAVEDLVKLGRKHGIGPVLLTQRGSGLNKEVSELCDMLVAFRTPGPLDQGRVKDWLDANTTKDHRDQVMGQLSGLPTGTAVFASGHPDLKVFGVHEVTRPVTFDSSATPKPGQKRVVPKKLAEPDLDELRVRMADAIERAKADDPKALRARIAELEKLVKVQQGELAVEPVVERIEVPAFDEKQFGELHAQIFADIDQASSVLARVKSDIGQSLNAYRRAAEEARSVVTPAPNLVRPQPTAKKVSPIPTSRPTPHPGSGNQNLARVDRALLTAFAQSDRALTAVQAAIISGYRPTSGGVAGSLAKLRASGFIEGSGYIKITDAGAKALGPFEPLPEGDALAEHWYGQLAKAEAAILRAVVEAHPRAVTVARVAEVCGYSPTSGGVAGAMAKLRKRELVHNQDGGVVADERLVDG